MPGCRGDQTGIICHQIEQNYFKVTWTRGQQGNFQIYVTSYRLYDINDSERINSCRSYNFSSHQISNGNIKCQAQIFNNDSDCPTLQIDYMYSDLYYEKQREAERERQRQREREIQQEQQRQREAAERQRQREIEQEKQRQREAEAQRQREIQRQKEREAAELQRLREQEAAEKQRQKEKQDAEKQRMQEQMLLRDQLQSQNLNSLNQQIQNQLNINTHARIVVQPKQTSKEERKQEESLGSQFIQTMKNMFNSSQKNPSIDEEEMKQNQEKDQQLTSQQLISIIENDQQNKIAIQTEAYLKAKKIIQNQQSGEEIQFLDILISIFESSQQFKFKPRNTQILAAFILYYKFPDNMLIEMLPSEGKTVVISLLAVLLVRFKKVKIDIITSTEYLARRDVEILQSFYEKFGIKKLKKIYDNTDIIYSTSFIAQSDYLQHTFVLDGRRGQRELEVCIVDEVDSMFIDKSCYSCQLSVPIPGIDYTLMAVLSIYKLMQKIISINQEWYNEVKQNDQKLANGYMPLFQTLKFKFEQKQDQQLYLQKNTQDQFIKEATDQGYEVLIEMQDMSWNQIAPSSNNKTLDKKAVALKQSSDDQYKILLLIKMTDDDVEEFLEATKQEFLKRMTHKLKNDQDQKLDITSFEIFVPEFLQKMVKQKLRTWQLNAVRANNEFHSNIHYLVGESVYPIDFKNTGELQFNTQYSDALHQFLCIKEGVPISAESLSSTHLSTAQYFLTYQTILGLSGTIGTQQDRKLLKNQYKVDTINIPRHKVSKFIEFPGKCFENQESWEQSIHEQINKKVQENRAVLVICECVKVAIYFSRKYDKYKLFSRSDDQQQVSIINQPIQPKDIIFATLVGARGADLNAEQVEKYGGIHIIFSFMPENTRIELQGYYRTARAGKSGSAQILSLKGSEYQDLSNFEDCKLRRTLVSYGQIEMFESKFKEIDFNDKLYLKFLEFYISYRSQFLDQNGEVSIEGQFNLRELQFQFGLLLKEIEQKSSQIKEIQDFYQFQSQFQKSIKQLKFTNPFYLILCGNELFKSKQNDLKDFNPIINYYTKAIEKDDSYINYPAYINRAAALIMSKYDDFKTKALNDFKIGIDKMEQAKQQLQVMAIMTQNLNGPLTKSIAEKINLLTQIQSNYIELYEQLKSAQPHQEVDIKFQPLLTIADKSDVSYETLVEIQESGVIGPFELKKKQSLFEPLLIGSLAACQIAVGAILMVTTGGLAFKIGEGLISEGISDIIYAITSSMTGDCNMKDYMKQKAISMTLSLVCFGAGKLYKNAKSALQNSKKAIEGAKATHQKGQQVLKLSLKNVQTVLFQQFSNKGVQQLMMIGADALVGQIKKKIHESLLEGNKAELKIKMDQSTKLKNVMEQLITKADSKTILSYIKQEGQMVIIKGENNLLKNIKTLSKVICQIGTGVPGQEQNFAMLQEWIRLAEIGQFAFNVGKLGGQFLDIIGNFIPQVQQKLEIRLQQHQQLDSQPQTQKIEFFIDNCITVWSEQITDEYAKNICNLIITPGINYAAQKGSEKLQDKIESRLKQENPNAFQHLAIQNKMNHIDQIGGGKVQDTRGNTHVVVTGVKNVLEKGLYRFTEQVIKSVANDLFDNPFDLANLAEYLMIQGLNEDKIENVFNEIFQNRIVDEYSLTISKNYKQLIEKSKLDQKTKNFVSNYLEEQLDIFSRAYNEGKSTLNITDSIQDMYDGVMIAKEEQKLQKKWIEEHNERKLKASYADHIDIQDYANYKNINIETIDENGNITIFKCNNPDAQTVRIKYDQSQQHFSSLGDGQQESSTKNCFYIAMGEEDPDQAKKDLKQWREDNPDKAFQDVMNAELISHNNYLKGYGRKNTTKLTQEQNQQLDKFISKMRFNKNDKNFINDMKLSFNDHIALLKHLEGYFPVAQNCKAGVLTLGHGQILGVKPGDTTTPQQAEAYLRERFNEDLGYVKKQIKVKLTERQYIVCASIAYNMGRKYFDAKSKNGGSKLLKGLNASKNYAESMQVFHDELWDFTTITINGKKERGDKGLEIRRIKEYKWLLEEKID